MEMNPQKGTIVNFRSDCLEYSKGEPPLTFNCETSAFPRIEGFIIKPVEEVILESFFPLDALKIVRLEKFISLNDESVIRKVLNLSEFPLKINSKLNIEIYQKVPKGKSILPLVHIWIARSEDFIDYFPLLGNLYMDMDWSKPIYHFLHPFAFEYTRHFFWFSFRKREIKKLKLEIPSPWWSIWERYKEHHMCRGIFFPTYKLRSLTFRGTEEIKFISLMNFTPEKVHFYWLVPEKWKKKIYWIKDGKKVHEIEVPPYTNFRDLEVSAYIDPEVTEIEQDFIPTVVIMQSKSRVEWLPLPLLREREEGDFYLKPEEAHPEV